MIETIYIDSDIDSAHTRYSLLRDQLIAARKALTAHRQMNERMERRLVANVTAAEERLQAEKNKIREELNEDG